jgi:hypothetical protein
MLIDYNGVTFFTKPLIFSERGIRVAFETAEGYT